MIYHKKSQPPPASLIHEKTKISGKYNSEDVLLALKKDFKNKCYICEEKEPSSINVEHFIPHKNRNINLKFDWNNLFYCCVHCNNTKLAHSKFNNILNCTIENDKVDVNIKYYINPFPKEKAIITQIDVSEKTLNTVVLLNEVYNGTTFLKKIESANIRSKLLSEIRKFQDLLFEFFDDNYNPEELSEIKNQIVKHLNSTSSFTAFKRWIIRENEILNFEFKSYL